MAEKKEKKEKFGHLPFAFEIWYTEKSNSIAKLLEVFTEGKI